jgi:hypothetical protein
MSGESVSAPAHNVIPVTPIQWDICAGVFLAFAVNLYEIPMLSLIVRPAVTALENLTAGFEALSASPSGRCVVISACW